MKIKKWYILLGVFVTILSWTCMFMVLAEKVSFSMNGFAVDDAGCLYIGKDYGIEVYDGDVLLKTISPKTSRGYAFTIVNGDTIVVSTGSFVYHMDLNGEVISRYEDERSRVYIELEEKTSFVDENGVNYKLTKPFGRAQISNGEEVIYKMPLLDYMVLISVVLCGIGLVVVIIAINKNRKQLNKKS